MTITGEQLKTARELLGWSRAQLAREAGMTVTAIADFENGKKRLAVIAISTIARILRTAGVESAEGEPRLRLKSEVTRNGVCGQSLRGVHMPAEQGLGWRLTERLSATAWRPLIISRPAE
jgi:transcriptional regulator with XRE-family HTH domain